MGATEFLLRDLIGRPRGVVDLACPFCGPQTRTASNRLRKVLRVWNVCNLITYNCVRCGEHGWAKDDGSRRAVRPPSPSPERPDRSGTARFLWSCSTPITSTIAEIYLRHRRCVVESPNLRFLPGRNHHHPALIARFGETLITGVHLTRLQSDGSDKIRSQSDQSAKIMIGPSAGQPIVVSDNPDCGIVIISEGIEDAASLALVTGWSAWAAGSVNRLSSVVAAARGFERVYVAFDEDVSPAAVKACRRALASALAARDDLIPVRFGQGKDANKVLIEYGSDAVLATVEWCEAKAQYARGQIGYGAFEHAVERANRCLSRVVCATGS